MNNLMRLTKQNVGNRTTQEKRFFKIRKLKVLTGKVLLGYAALPLLSFWAAPIGMMMIGIKPTIWARTKIIDLKERLRLR